MIGERLPDVRRDRPDGWDAWQVDGAVVAPPGAYMKVLRENGQTWCWYVRAPNGDVASIGFQNHRVEEHDDGTITASPSLVFPTGGCFHGWLRRGVWS